MRWPAAGPIITPSSTLTACGSTPHALAATPTRVARASAQARPSAVLPSLTASEPAVTPSFGVCAVSPEISTSRSGATSSSSAATWRMAVRMPWPSSTRPVMTVTLPSGAIRTQASSCGLLRIIGGTGGPLWGAWAEAHRKPMVRPASAEAAPMAKARRLTSTSERIVVMASHSLPGGALDGADDPLLAAAATQVGVHVLADLRLGGIGFLGEQGGPLHDHAAGAVAALQRLLGDEGSLQRVWLVLGAEPLEGDDPGIGAKRLQRRLAGAHGAAVDVHRAGTTQPVAASELRAVEGQVVAQHVDQRRIGVGLDVDAAAIDAQHAHATPPWMPAPPVCNSALILVGRPHHTPGRLARPSSPRHQPVWLRPSAMMIARSS